MTYDLKFPLLWMTVSMGLTGRRKTAQNLVDSRENWNILTLAVNRVKRVNGKKILLLRFDNFEERAKLTWNGCVSYFAATLTLYVPVSASFAFHEDSIQRSSKPRTSQRGSDTCLNVRVTEMFESQSICLFFFSSCCTIWPYRGSKKRRG